MANKRILKKRGQNEEVEMIDLISRIEIKVIPKEKNHHEYIKREKEVKKTMNSINLIAKKYDLP